MSAMTLWCRGWPATSRASDVGSVGKTRPRATSTDSHVTGAELAAMQVHKDDDDDDEDDEG